MQNTNEEINKVWDIAVFLQMMAAFCKEIDFNDFNKLMLEFHDFLKKPHSNEKLNNLTSYQEKLEHIFKSINIIYPLKRNYRDIAKDWNDKHKEDIELFSNGIMIGWLEQQVDLKYYYRYDYTPYHFKVGLVIHKGLGEIEEHFLLNDSFICLLKAKKQLVLLEKYANQQKDNLKSKGLKQFDKRTLEAINTIKYEVSFYSRMSIISFFSFLESFTNSIGFDYYYRNINTLNEEEIQILKGKGKKNNYLSLKSKIEKYQKIIRKDKKIKIVLSNEREIKEPFKSLFEYYNNLRNASVHYAPDKARIWLKPHDWIEKAEIFSKLIVEAALDLWKTIHETDKGPDYLGRLDYERFYQNAKKRENKIISIKKNFL